MITRILLFLFLLLEGSFVFSQSLKIEGKIIDAITEKPIEQAHITISKRKVITLANGEKSMKSIDESSFYATEKTDSKGSFLWTISAKEINDYFLIKITANGYEANGYAIFCPSYHKSIFAKLIKSELSEEEQWFLLLEDDKMVEEKNQAKSYDFLALNDPDLENENNNYKTSAGCSFAVADTIYVRQLIDGYNTSNCPVSGFFTGYLPTEEFIAGVIAGEMGTGTSFPLEAKKTQALCARTYALKKIQLGSGGNCGQAYSSNWVSSPSCSTAAFSTNKQVILYNNNLIIAYFAARCNGQYTQNANEATFSAHSHCNLSGGALPYCVCRPCSGHPSCATAGETPCCTVSNSCYPNGGALYGHGVGMCQRGSQQFANNGLSYCDIIHNFYSNICIANSTCEDSVLACNAPANNACPGALTLPLSTTCSYVSASSCGATSSGISSCIGNKDDDIWFNFTSGTTASVVVKILPSASYNPVFQVLTSPFGGNMTEIACINNTGMGVSEEDTVLLSPNTNYYIRVWHADAGYGLTGDFQICVRELLPTGIESTANTPTIQVIPNPNKGTFYIAGVIPSEKTQQMSIYNLFGQKVLEETVFSPNISLPANPGFYVGYITSSKGLQTFRFIIE